MTENKTEPLKWNVKEVENFIKQIKFQEQESLLFIIESFKNNLVDGEI